VPGTGPKVLLVEDEERLAKLTAEFLVRYGCEVSIEGTGDGAIRRILEERPDVVILDLMLPGVDGLEVCRQVRGDFDGAIVMLTARDDAIDEVVGLEVGADNYLAKPVNPRVLLAHVQAVHRRLNRPVAHGTPQLEVVSSSRVVRFGGKVVDLTDAEFDLVAYLQAREGEVVSRDELSLALRGIPYDGLDRSLDARVSRIRRKLKDDGTMLRSVRGEGYLMSSE
jgi:two-component system, OmpR family, response regulator